MPNFKYKARDKYGRPLSGIMSSENKDAVLGHLKEAGYTPVAIEESDEMSVGRDFFAGFKKVRLEDLIMFTRQLVTLQSAGLPLLMSLSRGPRLCEEWPKATTKQSLKR